MGRLIAIFACLVSLSLPASAELSEREWVEKLSPHFDPPPGSMIKFDHYKMLNFKAGDDINKLNGSLIVSTPKGECFDIELNKDLPDQRICGTGTLRYRFSDLDPYGRLNALVKTKANPFGAPMMWSTPYRVAISLSWLKSAKAIPDRWLIHDCHAQHDEKGRRIELSILGQKPWMIHFPEEDKLLPQPPPPPNLKIVKDTQMEGIMEMAERKRVRKEAEQQIKEGASAGVLIVGQLGGPEQRKVWSLPQRDSFEMSSDNFQPAGYVPKGGKGVCWYRYKGSESDPNVGRLECKDVDKFRSVYLPLSCLSEIRIDR